jgi:accessory gene regulator B
MLNNISKKITCSLEEAGAVPPEDKALYEYGIRMGILLVINVATALLIGLILGMLLQCAVFLIAFSPIRSYSGGYHARSPLACYLLSIPLIAALLFVIRLVPWAGSVLIPVLLVSIFVIILLAPVADPNKPLSAGEIVVYRRKARIFAGIYSSAALILWFAGFVQVSASIAVALVAAAALLISGELVHGKKLEKKA